MVFLPKLDKYFMDSETSITIEQGDTLSQYLTHPIFEKISQYTEIENREAFVIGGFVRDIILKRPSKDIDIVTVGSGISFAEGLARFINPKIKVSTFKNFGTAMFRYKDWEIEFVGARKESYNRNSRNPIVEEGTLSDDQNRRDFTINAMAINLSKKDFGQLVDPFGGILDLKNKTIKTPLEPDITFSDDPLRMMRAVRFATQLNFSIEAETFEAIKRNAYRLDIISKERIADELQKIMATPKPSYGWYLLDESGLLAKILPELQLLKGTEIINGCGHKDNFKHTLQVLDNVCRLSENIWLRWSALLHDIAKANTKKYIPNQGWTFHGHEFLGSKMVQKIFTRLKLPLNENMKYVSKMVLLHLRPIVLAEEEVTSSAIRRLLFDAGDDIDDLMMLCEADITSKNDEKVKRYLQNLINVKEKLVEVESQDQLRNFQPPVSGEEIMKTFGIAPCKQVGEIKNTIKDAILDGLIKNDYSEAYVIMIQKGKELGLTIMI
jgi:poly(A) polymerase